MGGMTTVSFLVVKIVNNNLKIELPISRAENFKDCQLK